MKQKNQFVNADDFGASLSVNEAIDFGFKKGILNRTTIMVNMPYVQDAVNKAINGGYMDRIGLHLNLTEGEPLTETILNYNLFGDRSFWGHKKNLFYINDKNLKQALRNEIVAQMGRYIELGFTLMHIDSHHHNHTMPSILPIVINEAKKHGFVSMRISRNIGPQIGFTKRILKSVVNTWIRSQFNTTKYFGGFIDYDYANLRADASVEVMVHPDIVDNKVIDFYCRKTMEYELLKPIIEF